MEMISAMTELTIDRRWPRDRLKPRLYLISLFGLLFKPNRRFSIKKMEKKEMLEIFRRSNEALHYCHFTEVMKQSDAVCDAICDAICDDVRDEAKWPREVAT